MTILVADDLAIVRELVATCLQVRGYRVICATDGIDALEKVRTEHPDLIVCDVSMPKMDGITFLQHLRGDAANFNTPVILLTGTGDKEVIVRAARLGVNDYLLKSHFSVAALLERVRKHLSRGATVPPNSDDTANSNAIAGETQIAARGANTQSPASTVATAPSAASSGVRLKTPGQSNVKILDPEECVQRIKKVFQGKTLSGIVSQVTATASSPRGDMKQLADMISRDATLSARVLSAANSAAYASSGGIVTTVLQAVRQIGFTMVRNIASAVGIFDAMPPSGTDGFNPLRCWQHSFAVAQFCEQLEFARNPSNAGTAYVVGLCHDLGEILLRTQFGTEYQKVLDAEATTARQRRDLELEMLGMTRQQLIVTITQSIGLPDSIRLPIEAFHSGQNGRDEAGRMAGILKMGECYANGLLLATGPQASVSSFARSECRGIAGVEEPPCPDPERSRAEVFSLTAMLARLKASEEAELVKPIHTKSDARIWLARDPAVSSFDPIHAALGSLGRVDVQPRLPTRAELAKYQGLAVVSWKPSTPRFSGTDLAKATGNSMPVLWAVSKLDEGSTKGPLQPQAWPVSLQRVVDFVTALTPVRKAA